MRHINALGLAPPHELDCDVCIVGSGPAGATIARELSGQNLRVLLLETGSYLRQDDADDLSEVENVGAARVPDQWLVRNRIVGGSSHSWSGRCTPFDDIDYEKRDWVDHSGWPFAPTVLTPYLDRAGRHLGLAQCDGYSVDILEAMTGRKRLLPDFDEAALIPHIWQFSRDRVHAHEHMRFGPGLAHHLASNVTLITNATVCDIGLNEAGDAITSVQAAAGDGARYWITARNVVLCGGGIENPRLLLSANKKMREGVGNQHDLVGRFLMDHLRGPTARFALQGTDHLRRLFGHYRVAGDQVFALGLRLSPEMQRAEKLLNCSAWLEGSITADDPWVAIKTCSRGQPDVRAVKAIIGNVGLLARGAYDYYVARNGKLRKIDQLNLVCMTEQLPDPASRITLSQDRDWLGMQRAKIDWRVHEDEVRTLRRMTTLVTEKFGERQLPVPVPDEWVRQNDPLPPQFMDVAHPTGTTRMGHSPHDSVVDLDCQVHGIDGLYIAGSSVFPTSSHANPTQMIVALALRLADTLRHRATTQTGLRTAPLESA